MFVVLLVTLAFGWWPFSFVRQNDVVASQEGLWVFNSRFEKGEGPARGIAFSAENLDTRNWQGITVLVELHGRAKGGGLGVFLEFSDEAKGVPLPALLIAQWQDHLAMRSRRNRSEVKRGYSEIGHRDVFARDGFVQLVISSEGRRTHVYADGRILESRSDFPLLGPDNLFAGTLVVGNSADGTRPFTGEIRLVAVYDSFYRANSAAFAEARPVLEFDAARDAASQGLLIPTEFAPLQRRFFSPIAMATFQKSGYRSDIVINSLGFIPIGVCFAALLRRRVRSFLPCLFLLGLASFSLSFAIEWGQGYLVHRDSSCLDLALNTLSGCMAVFVPRKLVLFL